MGNLYKLALEGFAKSERFKWIETFADTVDGKIREQVEIIAKEKLLYDPYDVEQLLPDIAVKLDECLAWRREIQELEARAFDRVSAYDLAAKLMPVDLMLASLSPSEGYLGFIADAYGAAAAKLAGADGPQAQSFKALYAGMKAAADEESASRKARLDAVTARQKLQSEAQEQLEDQHVTPGHALNFADRRSRLIAYLIRDFREALLKSIALAAGLNEVYDIDHPLPDLNERPAIDSLTQWCAEVFERLEYRRLGEVEFEKIISLHTPFPDGEGKVVTLIDNALFARVSTNEGDGIDVNLQHAFSAGMGRPRLRGVGLSCSFADADAVGRNALKIGANVFPPLQKYLFAGEELKYRKPPVSLGSVGLFRSDVPVHYNTSRNIRNVDPRGEWTIIIEKFHLYHDSADRSKRWDGVSDLKLHLLLAANPERDPAKWPA